MRHHITTSVIAVAVAVTGPWLLGGTAAADTATAASWYPSHDS